MMRIGIDLDNTILDFRFLFSALAQTKGWISGEVSLGKDALKAALVEVAGDPAVAELRWQQLQALAYGPEIAGARLFDGFFETVGALRARGTRLFIVSHKSRFSNLDPSVDLHFWARQTLVERGFFNELGFAPDDVLFAESRGEKVQCIAEMELDLFIDDLPGVFSQPGFPKSTQALLFSTKAPGLPSLPDWRLIAEFCLRFDEIRARTGPLSSIQLIKRGGNNLIWKLVACRGEPLVLKTYFRDPRDPRPRRDSEYRFLSALWDSGIRPIPQPLGVTEEGLFESYVHGTPPKGNAEDLVAMTALLTDLDRLSRLRTGWDGVGSAAHARFRLVDFKEHLNARWEAIEASLRNPSEPVMRAIQTFVEKALVPHRVAAQAHFASVCRETGLDPDAVLPPHLRFLSPSDFGPHNCLKTPRGDLVFLDFEYAGWDDPAKLLCDFLCHRGYDLPRQSRWVVVRDFIARRTHDPTLNDRLDAVLPLVALEWILIVLNVVAPADRARKHYADPTIEPISLMTTRLHRARRMETELQATIVPRKKNHDTRFTPQTR